MKQLTCDLTNEKLFVMTKDLRPGDVVRPRPRGKPWSAYDLIVSVSEPKEDGERDQYCEIQILTQTHSELLTLYYNVDTLHEVILSA
jgi:hypothetical protein